MSFVRKHQNFQLHYVFFGWQNKIDVTCEPNVQLPKKRHEEFSAGLPEQPT